jgi:hypothetical protein
MPVNKMLPSGRTWQCRCALFLIAFALSAAGELLAAGRESRYDVITVAASFSAGQDEAIPQIAGRPLLWPRRAGVAPAQLPATPHPAVVRVIAPEKGATAFGSGTLIDVRDQFGLVVTNWHVVRDATAAVEVVFPDGFRSHARPLKVDPDWDLAALVIWRPNVEPVCLAAQPPRPGDWLTIHGYGQGEYRIATGRCTQFYAPQRNYPLEMVELDVEARQGDSGGPIFNQRGELAGVLFGAGQGTTLGSFGPRVGSFLATLAPDIGQVRDQATIAVAERPAPNVAAKSARDDHPAWPSSPWQPVTNSRPSATEDSRGITAINVPPATTAGWYEPLKTCLAVVGLAAIALRLVKVVR